MHLTYQSAPDWDATLPPRGYEYGPDDDYDHAGLLAWTDDDGRMFAVDTFDRVVEVNDDTDLDLIIFGPPAAVVAGPFAPLAGIQPLIATDDPAYRLIERITLATCIAMASLMVAQFIAAWLGGRL